MKKLLCSFAVMLLSLMAYSQCGNLYIAGVIDGPLTGGTPKAVQLCASGNIADLSIYGVGSANNGGGTDGEEFTFPADALSSGDCIWVASESTEFTNFFGFAPCYTSGVLGVNGDDAIELFCSGALVDVFGDVNCDPNAGTGCETTPSWEYVDGWAVSADATANPVFAIGEWTVSGIDALDGATDNASAANPYPNAAANCPAVIFDCPALSLNIGDACDDMDAATENDAVDANCMCVGTPIVFDCPALSLNIGDACDDMDAATANDVIQSDCTCAGVSTGTCPAGAFINEFHYDNASTDMNEFVEVAVPVGGDGAQITITLYNGNGGTTITSYTLTSADLVGSDGTYDYYVWNTSMQNGPDGIAISCLDGTTIEFITYEGAFMATDGPFTGVMGTDVGVAEDGTTTDTQSIQFDGTAWNVNCTATPGATNDLTTCNVFDCPALSLNIGDACDDMDAATENDVVDANCMCAGTPIVFDCPTQMANFGDPCDDMNAATLNDVIQSDCSCAGVATGTCPAGAFVNEFHYDNAGADLNEFVEIAVPVGGDGTQITITLYNGSNGGEYASYTLTSADLVGSDGTYDYYVWNVVMQNGNDGIAISCLDGSQIEFVTYEGAFMATDGPFVGVMGTDVGVAEDGNTTDTQSIQFDGTAWGFNCTSTPGATNDLTTCNVFDCPALSLNIGDACDDMDAATENDVVDANCMCAGTPIVFDCPTIMANIGDACDDGDPLTINDVVDANCMCIGEAFDCPTIMANFGDACDDMDANTLNDVIQSDCSCAGVATGTCPAGAFINEFHYDNAGADLNEFVEIAVPVGSDGTQITITLYNGSNGTEYASYTLTSADLVGSDGTYDYYVWNVVMQNGNDGIAISCLDGTIIEFVTYEGAFMATDGPFAGMMGTDVGVAEDGTTTDTQSIQFDGTAWNVNCTSTPGATNDLTTCNVFDCPTEMANIGDPCDDMDATTENDVVDANCMCAGTPIVFDCPTQMANIGDPCDDMNAATANDVIQSDCSCAGVATGTCPAGAFINEFHYDNAGADLNEFVEIAVPVGGDGTQITITLYNGSNGGEYASYTLTSADLVGSDGTYDYYVWNVVMQNGNDGIAISCLDGSQIEFVTYEGAFMATDGPFVGVMGVDVGVAEDGTTTDTQSLQFDGTAWGFNCTSTPGATNDLTTCNVFDCPGLGNIGDACDDGDASTTNDTVQSDCTCLGVAYDCPTLQANFGDACDDMDAGTFGDTVQNDCTCSGIQYDCPAQMANFGDACDDMNAATLNDVIQNDCSCEGEAVGVCPVGAFISEFHYDNDGTDTNEFVEIAVPVGGDGTQITITLYNGNGGTAYNTYTLTSADLVGSDANYDYYVWNTTMQNGSPDGIAISCLDGSQIEFITYEGAFAATDGPFLGVTGVDIGVAEDGTGADAQSLQFDGTTWGFNCTSTPGATNDLSTCNVSEDCQLNIPMPYAGWHMISSYCRPDPDSITQVFAPIVTDVIQVKNLTGQVYVPSFNNFNTFTTWDITQGYLVKTFSPVTLPIIGGTEVDLNVDNIPLNTGWNMIAYWLQGDSDPIDVFDAIATDVIQVKNLNGAYVPSFNDFNNMGNMMETRGYQVKMIQDNILQYNAADILPRPAPGTIAESTVAEPVHFTREIKPNPNSSTILVMDDENNNLNYGDELGIFTQDGILVGSFVYQYDMMGGLAFGHDETEESKSGLSENETYVFKVWDSILDEEREVEMNFIQGSSNYQKDDLCAISFKSDRTTGINDIANTLSVRLTPNPASNEVNFSLRLDKASELSIEVYQMDGTLVDVVTNEKFATGLQTITYNVEHLVNGMYLYQVTSADKSYRERFTIAR